MVTDLINWKTQAEQYLSEGNYTSAAYLYEQAIIAEPYVTPYYWYLGLILLLQGQETEAQMTWMLPMAEVDEEEIGKLTNELLQVLEAEAIQREKLEEFSLAWVIRQHIREINPTDINNLIKIITLSIKINNFQGDNLIELCLIEYLNTSRNYNSLYDDLKNLIQEVVKEAPLHFATFNLLEASLPYFSSSSVSDCLDIFLPAAMRIGHTLKCPELATKILELILRLDSDNIESLRALAIFYQDSQKYDIGIKISKKCYSISHELPDKIFAIHLLLRGLMSAGGYWEEVCNACQELELLFKQLICLQPIEISEIQTLRLLTPFFAIPHIKDNPVQFKSTNNQVAKIFQASIQKFAGEYLNCYSQLNKNKSFGYSHRKLKVGYLSYALRQHSVGWLARWLIQHHDKEQFETYIYFVDYKQINDWLQEWYVSQVTHPHKLGMSAWDIAEKICNDEIDILIDLDSLTLDVTSEVIALKPAPLQATWLGWDASGIPTVDYFIADPYVLPYTAQDYYTEKIWRLPNTYIAVDGFEVGIPTLRRDELNIPSDAVVYLSAQRGYKRNPETTRWQMKIINEVANSYFLIKGSGEEEAIKNFFYKIADEEGVDCSRLKFLQQDPLESTHRANLSIADVVLDTYPYNGATTTLETLWMGIPLVTRVGEQFAARNSYTMMINAGITEGIAWTDEEYIEWGIRLGKDANLRQQVAWKLRQSRHTAPLWNAKQFTREMEKAYQQMWQIYVEGR
ncbi:O-linked N-acetylglucosamine transferase, SPINDLY family protein [Dulcicalothrix desertica]|nr:O-linked N-acetylglucosamine transferase, SPINDLY family protein [Dulcicalothrix desertica]TWH40109.1 putative O-linked N-acetylglucosamine transferase (SPINDLY family) [Dulcicalothrix desertica PCC 7102]